MRPTREWRSLCAAMACLPGLTLAQAQAPAEGLKHDPFARPALTPRPAAAAAAAAPAASIAAATPWNPQLRAVMVAGAKSMVDIDGTLVPLGGLINGHRLAEVQEESAVLVNGGKRIKLMMYVETNNDTNKMGGGK